MCLLIIVRANHTLYLIELIRSSFVDINPKREIHIRQVDYDILDKSYDVLISRLAFTNDDISNESVIVISNET